MIKPGDKVRIKDEYLDRYHNRLKRGQIFTVGEMWASIGPPNLGSRFKFIDTEIETGMCIYIPFFEKVEEKKITLKEFLEEE